jgi:hypothetical protein
MNQVPAGFCAKKGTWIPGQAAKLRIADILNID